VTREVRESMKSSCRAYPSLSDVVGCVCMCTQYKYVYICMCICMYVCMYVRRYLYTYIATCTYEEEDPCMSCEEEDTYIATCTYNIYLYT
jgi:hypothetical protein